MIINFHCKKTKKLFETDEYVAELDNVKKVAKRKLFMLHQASSLEYLRQFPNNQLEKLRDDQWDNEAFGLMTNIAFVFVDTTARLTMSKLPNIFAKYK